MMTETNAMFIDNALPRTPAGLRLNGTGKVPMRRHAFTITEMMVAMALIMLIMAILADAFTAGLKSFGDLKAVGDMDQKMRAALVIMARDLSDDHFGTNGGGPWQMSGLMTPTALALPVTAPEQGFLAIFQSSASSSSPEGTDADGLPSYRNTSAILHFTVNRGATFNPTVNPNTLQRRENYFMAPVAGSLPGITSRFNPPDSTNYYSQVAEVAYFLRQTTDTTAGGLPRFTLFRRQAIILNGQNSAGVSDATTANTQIPTGGNTTTYVDVSWSPTTKQFNKFSDVSAVANRRLLPSGSYSTNAPGCNGPIPIYAEENTTYAGNDILLTDVLSFCVQTFSSAAGTTDFASGGFMSGSDGPYYFDTATPGPPTPTSIKGIQIILRVWDPKTQAARQVTLMQDL
jgi:hypothetical protein